MAKTTIRFSHLLRIGELEFDPQPPTQFTLSDEVIPTISWLTAATGHDRKFLRCDDNGALLVADGWANMTVVENDELHPVTGVPDSFVATLANKGVLVATSTQLVKIGLTKVSGGATENIYIAPETLLWYPHGVYSVAATVVPSATGTASYVGISTFN